MKKRIIIVAVILIVATATYFSLNKSTESPSNEKNLVVGVQNDLINLDPLKIVDNFTLRVTAQIIEGMVTLNQDNQLVPALVESWTSNDDSTEWRLKVRKGVQFHPNACFGPERTREMTAEDVAFSLQRILSPTSPSAFALVSIIEGASDFNGGKSTELSGIQVQDDTVIVKLIKSDPGFLYRLTSPWFAVVPKEAVDLGPDVFGRTVLVGTGPYRFVSRQDNEVVVSKYENYWDKTPGNVSEITFRVIKNDAIRLAELRGGNVDLIRLPTTMVSEVAAQKPDPTDSGISLNPAFKQFSATVYPTFNSHFLGFNYSQVPQPLRVAISRAIRRNEISKVVTGGLGTPTQGPLPIGLRDYQPSPLSGWESVNAAKQILAENPDTPREIEILVHEKDASEQVAELIQSQLAEAGITATITRLDFNGVIDRVLKNNAQSFMLSFEYVFSTPELILQGFFSPEAIPVPNLFGFKHERFDELLSELPKQSSDSQIDLELIRSTEDFLIEQAPAAFLYQKRSAILAPKGTSGIWINGNNILRYQDVIIP